MTDLTNPLTRTRFDPPSPAGDDLGAAEVQAKTDADEDKGYHGTVADSTPNHAYTLQGVVAGEPTPETDPALAAKILKG